MNTTHQLMRNLRPLCAVMFASLFVVTRGSAQTIGQWDFNSSNLTATAGTALAALQYADGGGAATELATAFGSTVAFGLPSINGTHAVVMKFPAATGTMGYLMPTPAANGGGSFVNEYTLILDVLYRTAGTVRPLVDTDGTAFVPGSDFIIAAGGGIGVPPVGPFDGTITSNIWYRIGFTVTAAEVHKYINGTEVGSQVHSFEGRLALTASQVSTLILADTVGEATPGYVNSIQIRDVALNPRQMQAMGPASAAGIPLVVPPVPSFVSKWIPPAPAANRNTDVGVVIDEGDTAILESSITLKLDNVTMSSAQITRVGDLITVKTNVGNLSLGQHVVQVTYTDSVLGAQTYSNTFLAVLFFEDFENLALGTNIQEGLPTVYSNVWTKTPPTGWAIDDTGVPGAGDPALNGVDEWAGWSFADKDWWVQVAGDQDRSLFGNGKGTVAVADPDEWDDADHAMGYFNAFMKTPPISLEGVAANTVFIKFDSSFDDESFDDCGGTVWPPCPATNNQTAIITVSYNGGPQVQVLKFDSDPASPTFHDGDSGAKNQTVTVLINNPANATNVVITFGLLNAGNDWWWAVDNIQVASGPAITAQPISLVRDAGTSASFSVTAIGGTPLTHQWLFNGGSGTIFTNLPGATSSNLTFTAETNNAGAYRVVVTDPVSLTISAPATLTVFAAPFLTEQPVSQTVNAGVGVSFNVAARGRSPISYQWTRNGSPISGAIGTSYVIPNAQPANAGQYQCVVSNPVHSVTSIVAHLKIPANIAEDLVVHLKFDGDYADASGRGNNATGVGSPTFVAGKIGQAMQFTSHRDGTSFNYASLGYPADLHFTNDTPFSFSFWFKLNAGDRAGDPALIANKNWDSGNNNGFAIFTTGPLRFNYRELDVTDANPLLSYLNSRKDGSSSNIQDGNWHHCVVTFNRGGGAGSYVDGQLTLVTPLPTANPTLGGFYLPTTIDNDPANARSGGANAINIGQDGRGTYTDGGGVGITNAAIDDVGIWRRTLTPGEVQAIYEAGIAGNALNTAAPVTNPRPLDPAIAVSGSNVVVNKGNTVLYSAPAVTGPWSEATAARGTNVLTEPAGTEKFYRGGQP